MGHFSLKKEQIAFTLSCLPDLYNNVDVLYCGLPSNIYKTFAFLSDVLYQLGLKNNPERLVEPSTSVVCLGILINRIMSIPPDKLQEIIQSCHEWHTKLFFSKRQLQSLLGSLLYIYKCVRPARVFLNHMLTLLIDNTNNDTRFLSKEFFKDLNLFNSLMGLYFMMLDKYQLICVLMPVYQVWGVFMVGNAMPYPFLKISIIIQ